MNLLLHLYCPRFCGHRFILISIFAFGLCPCCLILSASASPELDPLKISCPQGGTWALLNPLGGKDRISSCSKELRTCMEESGSSGLQLRCSCKYEHQLQLQSSLLDLAQSRCSPWIDPFVSLGGACGRRSQDISSKRYSSGWSRQAYQPNYEMGFWSRLNFVNNRIELQFHQHWLQACQPAQETGLLDGRTSCCLRCSFCFSSSFYASCPLSSNCPSPIVVTAAHFQSS
jgi:hypothetical protein